MKESEDWGTDEDNQNAKSIMHPMQKKARWRMNKLIAIVENEQGIEIDRLYSLCFLNYGWSKRVLKDQIDLLVTADKLVLDQGRIYTYTHALSSLGENSTSFLSLE